MANDNLKLQPTTYLPPRGRRSLPVRRVSAPAVERETVRTELTAELDAPRLRRSA